MQNDESQRKKKKPRTHVGSSLSTEGNSKLYRIRATRRVGNKQLRMTVIKTAVQYGSQPSRHCGRVEFFPKPTQPTDPVLFCFAVCSTIPPFGKSRLRSENGGKQRQANRERG